MANWLFRTENLFRQLRISEKCVRPLRNIIICVIGISETNCTPPAIDDFPPDLFTRQQRQGGAVIFHIAVSLYLFLALAVVCDKYFVPAVEKICQGNGTAISFFFSSSLFSFDSISFNLFGRRRYA